jgi:hypothetical protein
MKLSEAIRAGSKMKAQGFKALFGFKDFNYGYYTSEKDFKIATQQRAEKTSCALGAALDGIGYNHYRVPDLKMFLTKEFPILQEPLINLPNERMYGIINIEATIIELNDEHHWTREAIADWVEQEEKARESLVEFKAMEKEVNNEMANELRLEPLSTGSSHGLCNTNSLVNK